MTAPSLHASKLLDVMDQLSAVKNLNEAMFMAAGSVLPTNPHWCNALQSVSDEVDSKLHMITDRLQELMEELA